MSPEIDRKAFRDLSYGLYIVTSRHEDRLNGQIVNTVIQVTSDPPRVAIIINKKNLTHEFIKESRVFAASVLCEETPLTFIGQFGFKSGRDSNKFEDINFKMGDTGAPIVLDNTVSYLEARVVKELDVGTHTIFVGEVVNADLVDEQKNCMTYDYYHLIKGGKTPKAAATYSEEEKAGETSKQKAPSAAKYKCNVCGYVYNPEKGDPDNGVIAGTPFQDIPNDF